MRLRVMSPMRAGDVVRCDFGTASRGEPGPRKVVHSLAAAEQVGEEERMRRELEGG